MVPTVLSFLYTQQELMVAQVKTRQDLIQEAWIRFEKALLAAPLPPWDVECAVDDLRDEMIQAGILDLDTIHEEICNG